MIIVAAGMVIDQNHVLLAQRNKTAHHALEWEFPGGKLEAHESPEEALARELDEELGIRVRVGRIFDAKTVREDGRELLILYYFAFLESGVPRVIDCSAFEWVSRDRLLSFNLIGSDRLVAERLQAADWTVQA